MGTSQSSSRSSNNGQQHHHQHQYHQNSSSPSPSSNGSHHSLHKALSRRRSSNKAVESGSTHGSTSHHTNQQHDSKRLPSHQEENEEEFKWYHGRRYHNTSSLYMLPNDSQEVDRLHLQHYIFKVALEKNIHVPIPDNGRVIDLGCGPATWTMDMATEMSAINFVGVDISPIYPTAIYPRNCNFYNEDILRGVSQPDNTFDVAYQRNVVCGFAFEHWEQAMKEAFRILKPGGYYECVEPDIAVQNGGPQTVQVFEHLRMSIAYRGVDPLIVRSLDRLMVAAGFVDVNVKEYCIPIGDWGGKVGQLWKQNVFSVLETVRPLLAKVAHISEAEVQAIVQSMHQETVDYKAHQVIYAVWGRKPEQSTK